ncbi:S9 family peptidase, partial [Acinetobacter baumannii]
TAEPPAPRSLRYADPVIGPDGRWVVCVRERHTGGGVVNDLVAIPLDADLADPTVLASGRDFYAAPRLSPAGDALAWIEWDHP